MGGSGGRINKPKAALCKKDARKEKRVKVKSLKRLSKKGRSDGTLGDTTEDILRQCRTNPKANVHLSGKKKRLLLKEARRLVIDKSRMETSEKTSCKRNTIEDTAQMDTAQMETT